MVTLAPLAFAAVFVRPLAATTSPFDFFAVALGGAGFGVQGEIGAGGGLTPVDPALAIVSARLDNSPSATSQAAAAEPGTLARTVVAVAASSGGPEIPIPLATANHPGEQEARADLLGEAEAGGVKIAGFTAVARATPEGVSAQSEVGSAQLPDASAIADALWAGLDALRLANPRVFGIAPTARQASAAAMEGVTTRTAAAIDQTTGAITATGRSTIDRVSIMGEIELEGVTGEAQLTVAADGAIGDASINVAVVRVAGIAFGLTQDGLVISENQVVSGGDLRGVEASVNGVLAEAGIAIALVSPMTSDADGIAIADSRGVRVTLTTPALADGGVPANDVSFIFGGTRLAITRSLLAPSAPTAEEAATAPATTSPAAGAPLTSVLVPRSPAPVSAAPSPQVAAPADDGVPVASQAPQPAPAALAVAGQTMDRMTGVALLGLWQALSLAGATAIVLRGRAA
ncbi:MAG: hypothetical protein ACI867_000248 [Glaciecola sp.]|jgi:hypothetical protein